MYLNEVSGGRKNNLDFIRFLAASLVILCHAYPISLGSEYADVLGRITGNQIHFGNLAVCIFFVYGGFLIAKSAERLEKTWSFFRARICRIFPCLIVVTVLLALLAGPFLTNLSVTEYYANGGTWRYLLNSGMILVHNLPGVFEGNVYGQAVNGPLWTLPIEFLCYIMCFLVMKLGFLNEKRMKWTIPVFVAGYLGIKLVLGGNELLASALRPVGMFYAGMLYYVYREKIKLKLLPALLALAALVLCTRCQVLDETIFIFLPYILMYLGYGTKYTLHNFAKHGEVSYGMYLCGWPLQQIICMGFGGTMEPLVNFAIALPLAVVCGFILNKIVEEPVARGLRKVGK